jgi:hypothetical protein
MYLQVYCTVQYHVIRTFTRPSGTALSQEPYVSLLFGQNGYLYASWPDCIKVSVRSSCDPPLMTHAVSGCNTVLLLQCCLDV